MIMQKSNNQRLQVIASAMQELNARLVYVGGAMAGAYATDPTATEPRTTIDVDCVVDSNSYAEQPTLASTIGYMDTHTAI